MNRAIHTCFKPLDTTANFAKLVMHVNGIGNAAEVKLARCAVAANIATQRLIGK